MIDVLLTTLYDIVAQADSRVNQTRMTMKRIVYAQWGTLHKGFPANVLELFGR
jgi:hypothetical protein